MSEADGRREKPFVLALAAVLGATVFGRSAQDMARWGMCSYATECEADQLVAALNIGAAVSALVAIAIAAVSTHRGFLGPREGAFAVVAAFIGALLALLAGAEPYLAKGVTIGGPLFFWGLAAVMVSLPVLVGGGLRRTAWPRLVAMIVAAALVAGAAGAIEQGVVQWLWQNTVPDAQLRHVLRPPGYAALVAGWAVIVLDPYLRPEIWPARGAGAAWWVAFFLAAAAAIAVSYGWLFLDGSITGPRAALLTGLLVVPPLVIVWLVSHFAGRQALLWRAMIATAAVSLALALGAGFMDLANPPTAAADSVFFIALHLFAGPAIVLGLLAAEEMARWLQSSDQAAGGPSLT